MLRFYINFLVLFTALGLLTGCSVYRIESEDLTLGYYPPKNPAQSALFIEKPDKPFEVVGKVSVSVENGKTFADVLDKMCNEASVLGGDAVTGVIIEPEGIIRTRYTAKVVVFK